MDIKLENYYKFIMNIQKIHLLLVNMLIKII